MIDRTMNNSFRSAINKGRITGENDPFICRPSRPSLEPANSYSLNRYCLVDNKNNQNHQNHNQGQKVVLRNQPSRSNSSVSENSKLSHRYSRNFDTENIDPKMTYKVNQPKPGRASLGNTTIEKISSNRTPLQALKLGRSAARSFNKKKQLIEKGQLLSLEISSKILNFIKNQDKLISNNNDLENLEDLVGKMEIAASHGEQNYDKIANCSPTSGSTNSSSPVRKINEICEDPICSQNRDEKNELLKKLKSQDLEIQKLRNEKSALLDEIIKRRGEVNNGSELFE